MNEANMKAMQTQINNVKNELRNEMKKSIQASMSNQTNELKNMMASFFQINTASTSGSGSLPSNTIANPNGELKAITTRSGIVLDGPSIPIPPPFINSDEDEREKLLELENTPLNENCSAVILKKLPEKLADLRKFLIPCGFNELKCKALADLGASINLMPLYVWKNLGLPELISTRMTLELAKRAIFTPAGIARDVFVLVGKFTFPADFVIVDYESDPRVPLILGRPFLRTARALIDVHGEEMILHDGDERLTINMRHDTSSYSNQPQKESINLINVFNDLNEDFLEDLFSTNHQSGNPTFSSLLELTSPDVKDDILDPEEGNVQLEKLLDLDSTKDLHPPLHVNPLSGITTSSYSPDKLLEEFADELPLITFPLEYNDDLQFDIKSGLKEIEYLGEKIKESKLLVGELDLLCDFLLPFEYDSFISEDFFEVDALCSTNNEDKVFNSSILIQENLFEINTRVAQDKKLAISHVSFMLEDFDPPLYELLFFKEVPRNFIVNVIKHIFRGRLLASFQDHEHEGGDTRSQGGIKDNDIKIKIQDHSMQMISQRNSQEQGSKLQERFEMVGGHDFYETEEVLKKARRKLQFDAKEPVGFDKTKVECFNCHKTRHFARECRSKGNQDIRRRDGVDLTGHLKYEQENFALMAYSNSGSNTEVTSCSKKCKESYAKLKKLYDEQREQLGDASIEIQAYDQGLKR
nr:reverse transcriptase domain-containing protein [Tanacetum cinerariifolium]